MPHRRMPSDAVPLASPAVQMRSPAWNAVPDDDDEEATDVILATRTMSASAWWMVVSLAVLGFLLQSELAPWWLVAIFGAEGYACCRRMFVQYVDGSVDSAGAAPRAVKRQRRLRHFTSLRLSPSAPIDEIVARFLALDALPAVRSIELGSNSSTEQRSHGHNLGLMATFAGTTERDAFLKSAERAAFLAFAQPFIDDSFVFDFESGAVLI